jgi:hypothetical protein
MSNGDKHQTLCVQFHFAQENVNKEPVSMHPDRWLTTVELARSVLNSHDVLEVRITLSNLTDSCNNRTGRNDESENPGRQLEPKFLASSVP